VGLSQGDNTGDVILNMLYIEIFMRQSIKERNNVVKAAVQTIASARE